MQEIYKNFQYEIYEGDYNYAYRDKYKEIRLIRYVGNEKEVTIPMEIDGIPVQRLFYGSEIFKGNDNVEKVIVSEGIDTIPKLTFCGCKNLKSVYFPKTLRDIKHYAFLDCVSLENVVFSSEKLLYVNINYKAFKNCDKLYNSAGFLILDNQLIDIKNITKVLNFPYGIRSFSLEIPEDENIIEEVNIPETVRYIKDNQFYKWNCLKKVNMLNSNIERIPFSLFAKSKMLEEVILPKGLKEIGIRSFEECVSLKKIKIPETVRKIEELAFFKCINLKEIYIESPNVKIDRFAFLDCDKLETIEFTNIESDLKGIKIKPKAFRLNDNMKSIPEKIVNSLLKYERDNYRLRQLSNWDNLDDEAKTMLYDFMVNRIKFRTLIFEKGSVDNIILYFNLGLHIEISELETYIEMSIENADTQKTAFLIDYKQNVIDKSELEKYESDKELRELGFLLATPTLKQLKEKWGISYVNNAIFLKNYRGDNEIEYIPSVTDTGVPILCVEYVIITAFLNANKENANKENSNKESGSDEIVIPINFRPLKKVGLSNGRVLDFENFFDEVFEDVEIPTNVHKLVNGQFKDYKNIKNIIIPETVRHISAYVFYNCVSLEKVVIHCKVKSIISYTFANCENLQEIELPYGVRFIGSHAFENCVSLEKITIPASVESIAFKAFMGCSKLREVNYLGNVDDIKIADNAFDGTCVNK